MQTAFAYHDPDRFEHWKAFPHWINTHHSHFNGLCYHALDDRPKDPVELAVQLSDNGSIIATYKCNISHIRDRSQVWIVLAPLVVTWEAKRSGNGLAFGRAMISHLSSAAQRFYRAYGTRGEALLIASGNLTEEKGGARFFGELGWEMVTQQEQQSADIYLGEPALKAPLAAVEQQIETAIAPLRAAGKVGNEPISFAILPLRT